MEIRRAHEGDCERVHPLLEQLMRSDRARRRAAWSEALGDPGYAAWVAEADGRPVGFIDLFVLADVGHGASIAVINNLVVDAGGRGRGIGRSLVRHAAQHCRERGVVEAHVWTDRDNAPAIRLYTACGFVDRGVLLELPL